MASRKNDAYLVRTFEDIEQKMWNVYRPLRESVKTQTISANNRKCLVFVDKAMKALPGAAPYFTKDKRKEISDWLVKAHGAVDGAEPIATELSDIVYLLLPPSANTVCIDIEELWMVSDGDEKIHEYLINAGKAWNEAVRRRVYGWLKVETAEAIFTSLLDVVETLHREQNMKKYTSLEYMKGFIKDISAQFANRNKRADEKGDFVFRKVEALFAQYAPPDAVLHVETVGEDLGTVAEEGEEEEKERLYLDIEQKLWTVYRPLRESAQNQTISANNGECFVFVQTAMDKWPGAVEFFTQDLRREIAAILGEAEETLDQDGTTIWHQLQAIIELLVPPIVSGDAGREGDGYDIPMEADVSTLLRQMKQLCA